MTDWQASGPDEFGDFHISNKGEQLAKCVVIQNGFRSAEETQAIALQVIKAVNNHERLAMALEEEREYWAGEIASAMLRGDPSDDSQDRVDRISRVLDVLIRPGQT